MSLRIISSIRDKQVRKVLAALWLAALLPRLAWADGEIFSWVDDKGALHATDRLADVPEPYYSIYHARLLELEKKRAASPAADPDPPADASPEASPPPATQSGQSAAAQQAAARQTWRALIAHWRQELTSATSDLQAVEELIGHAEMNPILRQTPAVETELATLEPRRQAALARVMAARRMLLTTLPERARQERVPPLWLL